MKNLGNRNKLTIHSYFLFSVSVSVSGFDLNFSYVNTKALTCVILFFVQNVSLSPIWNELKTTHQVLDVSYICEQVQIQMKPYVHSMKTSH